MKGPCLCGADDCGRCFPNQGERRGEAAGLCEEAYDAAVGLADAYDEALEAFNKAHDVTCEKGKLLEKLEGLAETIKAVLDGTDGWEDEQ